MVNNSFKSELKFHKFSFHVITSIAIFFLIRYMDHCTNKCHENAVSKVLMMISFKLVNIKIKNILFSYSQMHQFQAHSNNKCLLIYDVTYHKTNTMEHLHVLANIYP